MKLTKSLAELDAAADELLAKSKAAENDSSEEDVKPEEISETPKSEDAEADADEKEDASEDEDIEKCNVKKSEEVEDVSEDEENIEKSEDTEEEEEVIEKSEEEDVSEDEENIEKSEDTEEEKSVEEIEKSVRDDFEADDTIKKGMDDSEFFSSVVDIFAKSLSDMQYDVQTQNRAQSAASEILAKSLQAVMSSNQTLQAENERLTRRINKLEKSISTGFEKVMDSLDEIASQPAHMRKSIASVSVNDRDFDRSINGQQTIGGFESLSKSQVLTVLNNELYAGNQNIQPSDIISYESGAPLRQDLQQLVASKCK